MKKLLALLLALCFPLLAAAETRHLSVSVDVDEEDLMPYIRQFLQLYTDYTAAEADAINAGVMEFINGMGMEISVQEDALSFLVQLGAGELLNVSVHIQDGAVYVTSPMLSGYALWDVLQSGGDSAPDNPDWSGLSAAWEAILDQWVKNISYTVTSGVYEGDAYTGGTWCTTWVLTDQDIAALFSGLLQEETRARLTYCLQLIGLDAASLLNSLDELNNRVAEADAYLYVVRSVSDDEGDFVGASLTVLEGNEQVATLSFGKTEKSIKLVLGLGLNEKNYWWEFSGKKTVSQNITYLSGESREWVADKDESYSYVTASNAPMNAYRLRATMTKSGNRYLWDGNVSVGDDVSYAYIFSSSGSYYPDTGALECTVCLGDSPYELVRVKIKCNEGDAIPPLDSTLKLCSITDDADEGLLQNLLGKFAAKFLARLIKLVPTDLILNIIK